MMYVGVGSVTMQELITMVRIQTWLRSQNSGDKTEKLVVILDD